MEKLYTIILIVSLAACSMPEVLEQEKAFTQSNLVGNPMIESASITEADFALHYSASGKPTNPSVVFLHGTPGQRFSLGRYLINPRLVNDYYLVAIDRPGWGESVLPDTFAGGVEPTFAGQAKLIAPLLESLKSANGGQPIILVGHSLGASIAPRLAMDYPSLIDGLILLSGSHDPTYGRPRWYNSAASIGVVSAFLGEQMKKANREIMALREELEKMAQKWPDLVIPVTVIQGMQDNLVYPQNAAYVERAAKNSELTVIRFPESGHFTPWEHSDDVTKVILRTFASLNEKNQRSEE